MNQSDPSWGLRDVDQVKQEASRNGIHFLSMVDMPANNFLLVFEKRAN